MYYNLNRDTDRYAQEDRITAAVPRGRLVICISSILFSSRLTMYPSRTVESKFTE